MATRTEIRVMLQASDREVCVHALTGRAPMAKMCAHNYECGSCPYDQMLDDVTEIPARLARPAAGTVKAA